MRRALIVLGLSLLGGCASGPMGGYSFASTYDESIKSVGVPIVANETFYTGLDAQLTEAIAKEIQRATPWFVTREAHADTTLRATITSARYDTLSTRRGSGLPEEQAFHITVRFEWIDNRTGRMLASHRRFEASGASVQARPVSERVEVGQRQAIADLSAAMVDTLRSSW